MENNTVIIEQATLDSLRNFLSIVNKPTSDFLDKYDEYTLYIDGLQDVLAELLEGTDSISDNSPNYILKLFDQKPPTNVEYRVNHPYFKENQDVFIPDKNMVHDLAIQQMMQFLNISMYLYRFVSDSFKKDLLTFLLVSVSWEFESLFSIKNKIKFTYYFKKILTEQNGGEITIFKSHSWRGEFLEYSKSVLQHIDEIVPNSKGDKCSIIYLSNIYLSMGIKEAIDIKNTQLMYYIEIGTFSVNPHTSTQIFLTSHAKK
jgi:hypothetical protein